jgi:hypothetical protein
MWPYSGLPTFRRKLLPPCSGSKSKPSKECAGSKQEVEILLTSALLPGLFLAVRSPKLR